MSENKPRCHELIYSAFGWSWIRCSNTAKVERDGKHYCGIHDPVKVAERAAKRDAKQVAKWQEQDARQAKRREQDRRAECFDDLLAALKQCVGILNEPSVNHVAKAYGVDYALQDAHAALAKAKGE